MKIIPESSKLTLANAVMIISCTRILDHNDPT